MEGEVNTLKKFETWKLLSVVVAFPTPRPPDIYASAVTPLPPIESPPLKMGEVVPNIPILPLLALLNTESM